MSTCTFKVGDRVRNTLALYWPDAIVTEITDKGFKYDLVEPHELGPRYGRVTGGHAFETTRWELAPLDAVTTIPEE